ncbi:MAG: aldehyde dehydrogenase family protein [Terrimicrobiaceae bacterium]|nr:aldehyde dehydrogenase family protein [Terrimicrobiaceae bacterium]
MKAKRLAVLKTYKLFIGGAFPRSESGRVLPARGTDGKTPLGNYAHASRKDFRDAVAKARAAQPKWASASAYLRGQILYRAAELLECRRAELEFELRRAAGGDAAGEVTAAIDRLVHYAGWTDKYGQVFSAVNPVASPHFNFTFPEPTGVVGVVCPDAPPLLALAGLIAPAILSGNAVVALASERHPLPAVTFAEILATSDVPGGVVNILTGMRAELAPQFADHMDVNAVIDGAGDEAIGRTLQAGGALNLKRYADHSLAPREWMETPGNPYWILDSVEMKTVWHPMGV